MQDYDPRLTAPWERTFDRIVHPLEEFIHYKSSGGVILLVCAIMSFVIVNSPFSPAFEKIIGATAGFSVGGFELYKPLKLWINDGLMTLFFLLMGLEIKREFIVGELSSFRKALTPAIAAFGGMIAPAMIYLAINPEGAAARGWGTPMATDIAFAIGVTTLLGDRIPRSLVVFLISLAIVDDIGAVLIIAVYYTQTLSMKYLVAAGAVCLFITAMNLAGVRRLAPYLVAGALMWLFTLKSGVHSTIAGVVLAFLTPVRPQFHPEIFSNRVRGLVKEFDEANDPERSFLANQRQWCIVQTLAEGIRKVETPLQRLEHRLHLPVAFVVMPLFALVNAGVRIDLGEVHLVVSHPVALGVIAGLVIGKAAGVSLSVILAEKLGVAQLPRNVSRRHLLGVSLLAGIGFTMSIFIAELAFIMPENLVRAKTGIVAASVVAGIAGYIVLRSGKPVA